MEYVNSDIGTWQESGKDTNIEIWKRDYDPNTTLCMRSECYFPDIPPEVAYTCLADVTVRRKWDKRLESYEIIE